MAGQELYRYEDDQGRMVWGATVPSHLANRSYRVFDNKGRFHQEVARSITDSQEQARSAELARQARDAELRKRERQLDDRLMRRY